MDVVEHIKSSAEIPGLDEVFSRIVNASVLCSDLLDKLTVLKGAIIAYT